MYSIIISIALSLFCNTVYADSYSNFGLDLLRAYDIQIENYIQNLISDNNLKATFKDFLYNGSCYEKNKSYHDIIARSLKIPRSPDIFPFNKAMTIRHYKSFWNAFADKLYKLELINHVEYTNIKSVFEGLAEAREQVEPLKYIAADLARIELMENLFRSRNNMPLKRKR
jgi:hypothetical protein